MKKNTLVILLLLTFSVCKGQERLLIAAASDLRSAMDSIIQVFEQSHRGSVEITYGSSGKLTEQIMNGAPFDLLLSADVTYPEILQEANMTSSKIQHYARGRLVLWSNKVDPEKEQMNALLDPSVTKIAIANPKHAPYGKRAVESLEHYKLMEKVRSRLVYGENISQSAQFVTAGAADAAILAYSIALSPSLRKAGGNFFLIPEESHHPLIQGAVITRHGSKNKLAKTYFEYLRSSKAIAILQHYGFTIP